MDPLGLAALDPAVDVVVVPDLGQDRVPVVQAAPAGLGGVVARAGAPDVGDLAEAAGERGLQVRERVVARVGGADAGGAEPAPGGQGVVVGQGGLEEVDDLLVLDVLRAVALDVEGRVARGVLAELVAPEPGVVLVLRHPVLVHVRQQVELAERLEERADAGPRVGRHRRAVRLARRGVGRRDRVVLAREVAVLRVGAVAVVRPKTMNGPRVAGQPLSVGFPARVCVPELGGEHEAAVGLLAAGVDQRRIGLGGAREHRTLQGAGVVVGAQAGVETSRGALREERDGTEQSAAGDHLGQGKLHKVTRGGRAENQRCGSKCKPVPAGTARAWEGNAVIYPSVVHEPSGTLSRH